MACQQLRSKRRSNSVVMLRNHSVPWSPLMTVAHVIGLPSGLRLSTWLAMAGGGSQGMKNSSSCAASGAGELHCWTHARHAAISRRESTSPDNTRWRSGGSTRVLGSGDAKLRRGASFWHPATVVAAARAMMAVVRRANGSDDGGRYCGDARAA